MIAELNFISTRMKKLENSVYLCQGGVRGFLLKSGDMK